MLRASFRLGPYEIVAPIGVGAMGEVYRARDTRLERDVAVKVLPPDVAFDADCRQRFEREARAIAAINHPNICALYDVGVADDLVYFVMELLEGESLATRVARGPLPPDEVLGHARAMLTALGVLHRRGLVHRDLKPANIFLTPFGLKLLDFGLARDVRTEDTRFGPSLTEPGMILGTPRYMAPEQVRAGVVDARADLFAAAAVTFEMLLGRPAFDGGSILEVLHAVAYEEPPSLPEGLVPAAVEHALRWALSKSPDDRPPTADALLVALDQPSSIQQSRSQSARRVIVLPLRVLRPDPDTDFLAFSLPDAVAASLANLDGILVRSSLTAARLAGGASDLQALAREAGVDAALTGTLMRAGDKVRVSAQLVEVPQGAILWTHSVDGDVADLFHLQDVLTTGIVSSLELPLTTRNRQALRRQVPASARAYELYLRGNQLMMDQARWHEVRALYEEAVGLDPEYAPAWARLGRVLRVLAKYGGPETGASFAGAERAFQRALAIDPDLAIAHHLSAFLESETGRAADAMIRLLGRARLRPLDPELFAGLVATCRYCGLFDASLAAHRRATRLDPTMRTSVAYTYYLRCEYEEAIRTDVGDAYIATLARYRMGQRQEAIDRMARLERDNPHRIARMIASAYRMAITADELLGSAIDELKRTAFADPEGLHLLAALLPAIGQHDMALQLLSASAAGGLSCLDNLVRDPAWDPLRPRAEFAAIVAAVEVAHRHAADVFAAAGGPALLS